MFSIRHSNHKLASFSIWSITVGIFVIYLILNCLTPLWCDDLDYANEGHTFRDILRRETFDYLHANGRLFSHSLVQFFAGILGKQFFNPFNAFLTTSLICVIPYVALHDKTVLRNTWEGVFLISFSILLVWFVLPDQYITMFMIAGSSNYIWGGLLNLLFIIVFINAADDRGAGWIKYGFKIILAFFAGSWMEMYSVAILPSAFAFLLFRRKWPDHWRIGLILSYAIGTVFVVLAPGNFVRQAQMVSSRPDFATWVVNILETALQSKLFWVWIVSIVILCSRLILSKYTIKSFFTETLFFQIAIIFSLLFIYITGVSSTRALWGVFIFSFIIFFHIIDGIDIHPSICVLLALVAISTVAHDFSKELPTAKEKSHSSQAMIAALKNKELVDGQFILWPTMKETRKTIPDPTGKDGNWPGEFVARYHHSEPFSIVPEDSYLFAKRERKADYYYMGAIPIIGNHAVLVFSYSDNNVTIRYSYLDQPFYVFRNKIRRLLFATGLRRFAAYTTQSPCLGILGKLFLEQWSRDVILYSLPTASSHHFRYEGSTVITVPMSQILPEFGNLITECSIE